MIRRSGIVCMVLFVLTGMLSCSNYSPDSPGAMVLEAGQLGLSHLNGLSKSQTIASTAIPTGSNVQFDLGEIRASTPFYFLLYNTGNRAITDVTLSINDTGFLVYPATIDTLIPDGNVGMLPVVKVSALHGSAIDGIGNRPCLPPGENVAQLTIRGTTKNSNGIDTAVILIAHIKVTALKMSFSLRIGCTPIDLESPEVWVSAIRMVNAMGTAAPVYGMAANGLSVTPGTWMLLSNKGNVPVRVSVYYWQLKTIGPVFDTLAVGDSVYIRRKNGTDLIVCVDGNHTVTGLSSLQPQIDGCTYFEVGCNGAVGTSLACTPEDTIAALNVYSR